MIKYCPMCGFKVVQQGDFCVKCGLNLSEYQQKLNRLSSKNFSKSTEPTESINYSKYFEYLGTLSTHKSTANDLFFRGRFASLSGYEGEAIRYYIEAIKLGHTGAMYEMSVMYSVGSGVEKNSEKSLQWLEKAATLGNLEAKLRWEDEVVSKQDLQNYIKFLHEFAESDDITLMSLVRNTSGESAIMELAERYIKGDGVPVNLDSAMKYYKKLLYFSPENFIAIERIANIYHDYLNIPKAMSYYIRNADSGLSRFSECSYLKNRESNLQHNREDDGFAFRLDSSVLYFPERILDFVDLNVKLIPQIAHVISEFDDFYKKQGAIDNIVNKIFEYVLSLLKNITDVCIDTLIKEGNYTITADKLIFDSPLDFCTSINPIPTSKNYESPAECWKNCVMKIKNSYNEIVNNAQLQRDYREQRKENRARWHGSGYDMASAFGANMQAGMMNAAEGAAHSIFNFFGNLATDAEESSNKDALYRDISTYHIYYEGLMTTIYFLRNRILAACGFTDIVENESTAQNILKNLDLNKLSDSDINKILKDALIANPFEFEIYKIYLERYGDKNCEIRNIAVFFQIDEQIENMKKSIFIERLEKYEDRFKKVRPKTWEFTFRLAVLNMLDEEIPSYDELKKDYDLIVAEALKLQINLYGKDSISVIASFYRMFLKSFENEMATINDKKRIPAFKYLNHEFPDETFTVPEGVETIGSFAFAKSNLKNIKLPTTLKKIEAGAFFSCPLQVLEIPEGVEQINIFITSYGTRILLPSTVKTIIGERLTFEAVIICAKADYHPQFFFDYDKAKYAREYFRGDNFFEYADIFNLEKAKKFFDSDHHKVTILNQAVSGGAFNNGVYATDPPNKFFGDTPFKVDSMSYGGVEVLCYRAFANSYLASFENAPSLKIIRDEAFLNCQYLKTIKLPLGLKEIGSRAFKGCKNLEYIIIPSSVEYIGKDILQDCPATIYCGKETLIENYCKKNNLPMKDYGSLKLQEGKEILLKAQTKQEVILAYDCFVESAEMGNIIGAYEAGKSALICGNGINAEKYFLQAAESQNKEAMLELYKIYRDGVNLESIFSVQPDATKSEKWLKLSGYDTADNLLKEEVEKISINNYLQTLKFINKLYPQYKDIPCLYFDEHGEKAKTKIKSAIEKYAQEARQESVIFVFDDTIFGGAEDGMLVTNKNIYVHTAFSDNRWRIAWDNVLNIKAVTKFFINNQIQIDFDAQILTFGLGQIGSDSNLNKLIEMLRKIREVRNNESMQKLQDSSHR